MVAHTCHPSPWEMEKGDSDLQGHLSATQQVREESGLQEPVLKQGLNTQGMWSGRFYWPFGVSGPTMGARTKGFSTQVFCFCLSCPPSFSPTLVTQDVWPLLDPEAEATVPLYPEVR